MCALCIIEGLSGDEVRILEFNFDPRVEILSTAHRYFINRKWPTFTLGFSCPFDQCEFTLSIYCPIKKVNKKQEANCNNCQSNAFNFDSKNEQFMVEKGCDLNELFI